MGWDTKEMGGGFSSTAHFIPTYIDGGVGESNAFDLFALAYRYRFLAKKARNYLKRRVSQ